MPGVRPPRGEIFGMFLVVAKEYIDRGFVRPAGTPEYQQLYGSEPTPQETETWFNTREESAAWLGAPLCMTSLCRSDCTVSSVCRP